MVGAPVSRPSSSPDLPPVERVRPGIWSIPVPLPNTSLRYVFVYLFETDRGAYIVDAGWNTDDAFNTLQAGVQSIGYEIADVRGVLVTHIHPDHYGLAGRIRDNSGAWISLHPADAALVHQRYEEPDDLVVRVGDMLRAWGAPSDEVDTLQSSSMPVRPFVDSVTPDVLLEDGAKPDVPDWDLTAIWTPGHSPGHLCFWEDRNRLMLSGDHVLPRITPNVPFHPQSGSDPLGDFLASLDKVDAYEADEVLPAHEYRFLDLQRRTAELRDHHEARFGEIVRAIANGFTTTWSIATQMQWARPWDEITGFMRRAAVAECMAHLTVLRKRGIVRAEAGEPMIWSLLG